MGVSLTILAPPASRTVAITGFHVDSDGIAAMRTTTAAGALTTGVVISRLSDAPRDLTVPRYARAVPCAGPRAGCEPEVEYRIAVGPSGASAARRDLRLRMALLIVPGT